MNEAEPKPCRHCGTETTQRASGIPYCSMDCIGARRREKDNEVLECPYPDCDWKQVYDPENGLSRSIAYTNAEEHREEHRSALAAGGDEQ
ncbi:hypothetical protein [Natronosalvus halobius]|uniref:hypothetical protein n=1 Tax=Natronosalvus halobius TaxID=2953746 RepID=UPI00209E53FB|nr:hypothetical protein [Natronosalvus halobius]USZ73755.1 hypothetical protein NGM15_18635 [Natronosalvus halobius]